MVAVAVLGGVRAESADDAPLDVGPPKCQLVLAALALNHGEAVTAARLIDLVWAAEPPGTAPKILQGYVSRLRKALGADAIATVGAAYRLERDVEVDVTRFQRLAAAGDVEAALALWAGPPLAGLDPVGLQSAVDGLRELWLDATEQRLARLADRDPARAIPPLTELTEQHPFREGFWATLMRALARTDRQADALGAFKRARTHLVEELGIDPGARLTDLEQAILAGEISSPCRPRAPEPFEDVARADGPRLPAIPELLGRDDDMRVVLDALRTASLVTLLGPGGIGKTSLAIAVARAWHGVHDDRVAFVELNEVTAAEDVMAAVAETFGVAEPGDGHLRGAVVRAVGARPTLLVLDNCEHVLDATAELVRAFGDGGSTTRLLATSRERLGAVREHLHPVAPLEAAEEATELFLRRARAVAPGIDLSTDRTEVAEICRQLDGVPLAIELAAARTRTLTTTQLLERLGDRFRLLAGGRGRPDRQTTLASAVAWSHDLLTSDEQLLFARLSVFTGPFDLVAAEAVGTGGGLDEIDVDRLLGDLVERSMVAAVSTPSGRRFRLLETLRQFAAHRLAETSGAADVATRHAAWVAAATARIGEQLAGPDEMAGVQRLDELWPNLRAAFDHALRRGDIELASGLLRPVVTELSLRRRREIGSWAERILAAGPLDGETELFWLLWGLHRHMQSGNASAFETLVERHGHEDHALVRACRAYLYEDGQGLLAAGPDAVTWLQDHGDHHAATLMEFNSTGAGLMTTARFDEAVDRFREWVARHAATGPPTFHYFALGFLGYTLQLRGEQDEARACFLDAAAVAIPPGTYSVSRPAEVEAVFEAGNHDRALSLLLEHIDDVVAMGTVDVARLVAVAFVNVMAGMDELEDAARALAFLDTVGDFGRLARTSLVAEAAARIGDVEPFRGDGRAALQQMRAAVAEHVHGRA